MAESTSPEISSPTPTFADWVDEEGFLRPSTASSLIAIPPLPTTQPIPATSFTQPPDSPAEHIPGITLSSSQAPSDSPLPPHLTSRRGAIHIPPLGHSYNPHPYTPTTFPARQPPIWQRIRNRITSYYQLGSDPYMQDLEGQYFAQYSAHWEKLLETWRKHDERVMEYKEFVSHWGEEYLAFESPFVVKAVQMLTWVNDWVCDTAEPEMVNVSAASGGAEEEDAVLAGSVIQQADLGETTSVESSETVIGGETQDEHAVLEELAILGVEIAMLEVELAGMISPGSTETAVEEAMQEEVVALDETTIQVAEVPGTNLANSSDTTVVGNAQEGDGSMLEDFKEMALGASSVRLRGFRSPSRQRSRKRDRVINFFKNLRQQPGSEI